ncbi:MAG: hypothetical protein R3A78_02730 [Polyangiales bacterium]|nr:hypothetical protein [Myxococcales bacterium]
MKRFGVLTLSMTFVLLACSAVFAQPKAARREAKAPHTAGASNEGDAKKDASRGEGREVEEGGGKKVKEYRFTGLDVSGSLKSPQLLYFLNRLRAEFDRPKLGHRSFMPELARSAKEKSF